MLKCRYVPIWTFLMRRLRQCHGLIFHTLCGDPILYAGYQISIRWTIKGVCVWCITGMIHVLLVLKNFITLLHIWKLNVLQYKIQYRDCLIVMDPITRVILQFNENNNKTKWLFTKSKLKIRSEVFTNILLHSRMSPFTHNILCIL